VVHRFRPAPDELTDRGGIAVTTGVRAAYDLGRRPDRTEAVVAIDALAAGRFPLTALLELAAAHRGDRGLAALRAAVFNPHAIAIRMQRELVARGAAPALPLTARW
jgi:hypothetical protein